MKARDYITRRLSYRVSFIVVLAALLAASGCLSPSQVTPPAQSPTAAPAPPVSTPVVPPAAPPLIEVTTLVENLEVPWAMDFAPDGRIFITERTGAVRIVKDGQLQPDPWLALDIARSGEGGLLGLALDPAFAQNRFVYIYYTYRTGDGQLQNRLVRLREDPATGRGAVDRTLLDGIRGASNHDAGRIKFGPDGKLYVTTGDAGVTALSQDPLALNGKILRLNSDGTIPADNPFPGSPVYSYGHRNPEGLAWQRRAPGGYTPPSTVHPPATR